MHPLWPNVEARIPQLWRAVCGYEAIPALQQELLQEVLLAIWEGLPSLRDPDRLPAFALRVAHNLGASHARDASRRPCALAFDEELHGAATHPPTADADDARARWLFEAVRTLPLNLRQVLMLQLEGYEYREIAEMVGISIDNVGVRVHRARARLKQLLDKEDHHAN